MLGVVHSENGDPHMSQPDRASRNEANYALSLSQNAQLDQDLTEMRNRAVEISNLIAASFGSTTDIAIRAGEVDAALQRLIWCLDRERAANSEAGLPANVPSVLSMRSQSGATALAARR
jgi:hypothetical protein